MLESDRIVKELRELTDQELECLKEWYGRSEDQKHSECPWEVNLSVENEVEGKCHQICATVFPLVKPGEDCPCLCGYYTFEVIGERVRMILVREEMRRK